jgi:hypothetical protein
MAKRGELTDELKQVWKESTGRDLTTTELRLVPYFQYVMLNDRKLDPAKMNGEERAIFQEWKAAGFVDGGATGLRMTREFYDAACRLLWIGYATYDCREMEVAE